MAAEDALIAETKMNTKTIVICGSMRFYEAMIGFSLSRPDDYVLPQPESLRELARRHHRERIESADSVLVFNYGNYIGKDTEDEIQFAQSLGKPVEYLEDVCRSCGGDVVKGEPPCDSCNHPALMEQFAWSAIGRSWRMDSSLEKWFPFTAERLSTLESQLAKAREIVEMASHCICDCSSEPYPETHHKICAIHVAKAAKTFLSDGKEKE